MTQSARRIRLGILIAAAGPVAAMAQSGAESYPSRPVTIITTSSGSSTAEMRLYAEKTTESMGRPFVIVDRPGAGGTLATGIVAKSAPDGYTLLLGSANFTTGPAFHKSLPYDPVRDFAPVSILSKRPTVLMVHPSLPVKNAREYFSYARANPGKINFGTVGPGSTTHINSAWMHSAAKVKVTNVHYKGTGALLPDILSGRIQATAISFLSSMPLIKSGKTHALGITTATRSKLWPDLPTVTEQGAPGYDYSSWLGLIAPAKTPRPIIDKLHEHFARAAQDPEIFRKLSGDFIEIVSTRPEQAAAFIREEIERWKSMSDEIGLIEEPA